MPNYEISVLESPSSFNSRLDDLAGACTPACISSYHIYARLIIPDPMFYLSTQSLETDPCVPYKIWRIFLHVKHATIPILERLGRIPVEKGNKGPDPVL